MFVFNSDNQKVFAKETADLTQAYYNISNDHLKSIGFSFVRNLELTNRMDDRVKMDIFEDGKGNKIVLVCVTQIKPDEGEVCHHSCFAPESYMSSLAKEHERYWQ